MATTLDRLAHGHTTPTGGAGTAMPFVLGIIGDSGSGKNTMVRGVRALLGEDTVTNLELDDYIRYTRAERAERGITALSPLANNLTLMAEHLQLLREGKPILNRSYEHSDGTFGPIRPIQPNEIMLVRGLLGYPNERLRGLYDLAVFLDPEPDLLFRWKLRRDTRSRGYTEAEALMRIAEYLLDSKQYVRPQAAHADIVVRQELPAWDAPDGEVRMTLVLRNGAAAAAREAEWMARFSAAVELDDGADLVVRVTDRLSGADVEAWGRDEFPATYDPHSTGGYTTAEGAIACCAQLAFAQVLIAAVTQKLRGAETVPA